MAIPEDPGNFTPLRFFRFPISYPLPESYEGYWYFDGPIVDGRATIQTRSLIIPQTDSSAFIGENEEEEETFEAYIQLDDVYSFKLVNSLYDAPCFNLTIKAPPNQKRVIVSDRDYFSNQYPSDVKDLSFDFKYLLNRDESIITSTWTVEVRKGEDPDPQFILVGAPTIDGSLVTHSVGNGVNETLYKLKCEVMTDQSNEYTLCGFLLVRELCD